MATRHGLGLDTEAFTGHACLELDREEPVVAGRDDPRGNLRPVIEWPRVSEGSTALLLPACESDSTSTRDLLDESMPVPGISTGTRDQKEGRSVVVLCHGFKV